MSGGPLVSGRRALAEDAGQVIVLFAVSLPLFLALLLLAIDGGRLLIERERLRGAAQLAAEAAVSLAADRQPAGDPLLRLLRTAQLAETALSHVVDASALSPTADQVRAMAKDAVLRNLPERGVSVRASIVSRRSGEPFAVTVKVEKDFVSTIGRISFHIAAEASAQLGQSVVPVPAVAPQPAAERPPTLAARACLKVYVASGFLHYQGRASLQEKMVDSRTETIDGAAEPVYAAPGTRHTYAITLGPNSITDEFTLPATVQGSWYGPDRSVFVSGVKVNAAPVAYPVTDARCP